jgi:phage terminase large subunit
MYGIASPFAGKKEVASFHLFGNKINMLGADSDTVLHGVGSDYLYFNEFLDIPEAVFNQLEMRCRKFWWGDYNPKATVHWVYDRVCHRPDVGFLKTTFLDNPYLSVAERRKILSYEPTHPDDRGKPRDKRRPHPTNIAAGTADEYMWDVYGLGLRSAPEGLIFKDVTYIDEFPTNIEKIYFGGDIGETESPSTLVKVGVDRKAKPNDTQKANIYIECLAYEPTPSTHAYVQLASTCMEKHWETWVDSAQPSYITAARSAGYRFLAVNKYPGSILDGIGIMKNYKIHLVKNQHYQAVLKEQTNYKRREVNGIRLEEPIDDFNHMWDAARYACLMNLRHN